MSDVLSAFEVLRSLPAFLCVCQDGKIAALNRYAAAVVGVERTEDLIGKEFDLLLSEEYRGLGDELLKMIAGETDGVRLKLAKGLGKATDIEVTAILQSHFVENVYVLYGIDITDKIRGVEMLYQRERRYRSIIENAGGMICETEDGVVTGINMAGMKLLGVTSRQDVEGQPVSSLFHEYYRDLFESELPALIGEDTPVPMPLLRPDGEIRDVEVIVTALDGETARHLLVEVHDISAQNQALQALRTLNENLEARVEERTRTLREAQQRLNRISKLEAIGAFAGGIAHEINTPIQFLADNLKFLQQSIDEIGDVLEEYAALSAALTAGKDPQSALSKADRARADNDIDFVLEEAPLAITQSMAGVSHIAKVVQAMRDFADRRDPAFTMLDLSALISDQVASFRESYGDSVNIVWSGPGSSIFMQGAREEIAQALGNVVDNAALAVKGTAEKFGRVEISLVEQDGMAVLSIKDDGIGMPEETLARAFDPFFTTRDVGEGIGQGLAIAHHIIVDRHGGEISLNSAPGRGCDVCIKLPCESKIAECIVYETAAQQMPSSSAA